MKKEEAPKSLEEQALEELTRFGTSLLQIRSMTKNFSPGKMCQNNHHIEFLSPDGKWFMRMTRVGKVEREQDRINIEIPSGDFHVVLREEDCSKLIERHQIESGDIIFEVFPYGPEDTYWYRSVTAHGDDDNPNPPFQPLEKIYNLTRILKLPTPEEYQKST